MAEDRVQRRLTAILAADVVGYSRLMGEDEEGTLAALTAHRTGLIEPCIGEHRGRVVKTTGDGLLAEFASVVDAVRCAVALQEGMRERNAHTPANRLIAFRIGINLGDVIVQDDDVYGDGVNIAARLEGLADPGGIVVSDKVHAEVRTRLDLGFHDLGPQEVKNIADPVRAFRVEPPADRPIAAAPDVDAVFRLPSIAVLPFENMSGDPEQEYFGDGIAEDLITALSRIRLFRVIARNSSFAYKHQSPDIREVSQELGARYIVEGSVRKAGNRIRVSAQLIEGETGNHVWAQRFDRELDDIFAVQDELTETLAGAIEPEMKKSEQHRAAVKATENLDAWELYHRGMHHLSRNFAADFREARSLFQRAMRLDPNFGPAHAAFAEACARDRLLGSGEGGLEEAMAAARKAVRIDSEDPVGHVALGIIHLFLRDPLPAIGEFETAIRLNPSLARAYNFLGTALVGMGRAEEALPHLEHAIRLSPADPDIVLFHNRVGMAKFCLERYDDALEYLEATTRMPASNWPGRAYKVAALAYLGRTSDLPRAIAELREVRPDFTLSFVRERLPFIHADYVERLIEGLRRAGLPD